MIHARASVSQARMSWRRIALRTVCANRPNVAAASVGGSTASSRSASSSSSNSSDSGEPERCARIELAVEHADPDLIVAGQRLQVLRLRRLRRGSRWAPARTGSGALGGCRRVGKRAQMRARRARAHRRRAGRRTAQNRGAHQPDDRATAARRSRPAGRGRRRGALSRIALQITASSVSTAPMLASGVVAPASSPVRATSNSSCPSGSIRRRSASSASARTTASQTRGPSRGRSAARIAGASSSGACSSSASSQPLVSSSKRASSGSIGASATAVPAAAVVDLRCIGILLSRETY